jgi:Protein of unknown function (DUF2867)
VLGELAVIGSSAVRHGRLAPRVSALMGSTMPSVDWCDAFWVELPRDSPDDPLYWRDLLFGAGDSRRPSGLMRLRDLFARQVGLKNAATGNGASYPVLASDGREVVVGMDDRHLDFRVALTVRPFGTEHLVVTTAVRRHNRFGHAYFALVKGPHRVLVPPWARRAIRRAGAPSA